MKAVGAVSAIDQAILLGKPLGSVARRWVVFVFAVICLVVGVWLSIQARMLLENPQEPATVPEPTATPQPAQSLATAPTEAGPGSEGRVQIAQPADSPVQSQSPDLPPKVEVVEVAPPSLPPSIPKAQPIAKPVVATVTASPRATAATATTSAPHLGPCAAMIAGKATISMDAIGVRSVLPGSLTYTAGGKQCVLSPGTKIGDEVVRSVDAELLKIHTSKRVIQLIDN